MRTSIALLSLTLFAGTLSAQAAGLRGAEQEEPLVERLGHPDPEAAERVITIEAVAEVRVVPSRLRVVFAVSARGEHASSASKGARALLADTRKKLSEAGVEAAAIDTDFIAAVPVFGWQVEEQGGKSVVVERRTATRVHYNLQVSVADEAAALKVIEVATAGDGVDLLAVDYWSEALAAKQVEAQGKALAAAQQKAKLLLSVFPDPPLPINVSEVTRVLYPQQLYGVLPNVEDSANAWYYGSDDMPRITAPRPLQIYYRGMFGDVDAVEAKMPGARVIEVVSTVRLFYKAPARPEAPPK